MDWAIRESVQAKMKMTIKRLLKKYGYPPDKTARVVDIVMEQTKLMCQNEVAATRHEYPNEIMHSVTAFANDINNWGGGYIVIGIEEFGGKPV